MSGLVKRPVGVGVACAVMLVFGGLGLAMGIVPLIRRALDASPVPFPEGVLMSIVLSMVIAAAVVALAILVFLGVRWARLVFAIFAVFTIVIGVIEAVKMHEIIPSYAYGRMVGVVITVLILVLLYTNKANAYFRGQ